MNILGIDEVPLLRGLEHRGGTFHSQTTAEGKAGTTGNFKFSLSRLGTDYSGPRHRHNFDQFRFMLEGESDYGDGSLRAGQLGYFPEGVPYGPQINKTPIVTAVLQFGGASGSGYIHPRDVKAGMEELRTVGEFKDGVFHRHEGLPGKRNMEAYQAIWEHLNAREMVYPKGRYSAPIFMDAAHFDWVPAGAPGVFEKLFGVWTECRTEAGLLRLEPGAAHEVQGRGVYFVLSGNGDCQGKTLAQHTTIFLDRGERAKVHALQRMEILHYGLPNLIDMEATMRLRAAAE